MTPAGGLTRDEAQAAALKAKERELKSPGKKPRRPASIKELKAKIKLTDAKAIPVNVNDPGLDRLKGISARMRPKTATEAAAAAKAIPALPAAAAAQAVPVQVLADVAIAAARVIGIAAGDAVPIAEGKPPRGPLAAYKGSALFPAAAGAEKKLKKKRIIPGISPVLRDGADGVNPEDMVYYEGQGEGQDQGQDVDQGEGGEEEYEDADEYVDDEGAYEEGENEGGSPGSTGSFGGFIPAGGQAGSGRSTPGGPGDGRVSLPAGFRRAAPGTKGAVTARDAIASGMVAAGMVATDAGVDSGLLESDGADLSGTAGKGLRAGLRAARKHAAENSAAVARRAVGASARGPKGPNSKPSNRYAGGGGFRTGGAGSGPGLGRSKSLPTSGGVRAAAQQQQQQQHAGRPPAGGSTRLANTTVDQPSGSSRDRLQNVYAAGDAAFHGAAEPADADEYVKMYSRTSLERVLKEVAAMGGLDKFVDSENEDEDGDVNVTAEDMEQIINLVKMKRRERAGTMERGRKKTGGGLVGKMAENMIGSGANSDADSAATSDAEEDGRVSSALKEKREKFAEEVVKNIERQLGGSEDEESPSKPTAQGGAPAPPPPPPPPGGKLPGAPAAAAAAWRPAAGSTSRRRLPLRAGGFPALPRRRRLLLQVGNFQAHRRRRLLPLRVGSFQGHRRRHLPPRRVGSSRARPRLLRRLRAGGSPAHLPRRLLHRAGGSPARRRLLPAGAHRRRRRLPARSASPPSSPRRKWPKRCASSRCSTGTSCSRTACRGRCGRTRVPWTGSTSASSTLSSRSKIPTRRRRRSRWTTVSRRRCP